MTYRLTEADRTALRPIAQRIVNAENDFVEVLMSLGNVDDHTARKIMAFYLRKRFAKIDTGIGRISVKHGAFLGARAIANAAAIVNAK